MIIYKKSMSRVMQENVIMLELEDDGGFVYVSKNTYDEALLLSDRFEGDLHLITNKLNMSPEERKDIIRFFYETAPEPINILAPFINFVKPNVELEKDMELLCGVLHQISRVTDFNEITKVPVDVRADISFTKNQVMKYKENWESMETKFVVDEAVIDEIKIDALGKLVEKLAPLLGNVTVSAAGGSAVVEDEEDDLASLFADLNSSFKDIESEVTGDAPAETPAAETVPEVKAEVQEPAKPKTEAELKAEQEMDQIQRLLMRSAGGN